MARLTTLNERIISLKFDPARHPLPSDTLPRVVRQRVSSALTRPDVALPGRVLHALWFVALALAPRPLARSLATQFLWPVGRPRILQRLVSIASRSRS